MNSIYFCDKCMRLISEHEPRVAIDSEKKLWFCEICYLSFYTEIAERV